MKRTVVRPAKYAALLRAINVGGNTIIKMDRLRRAFESMGMRDVSTHIQSGNVVFTSKEADTHRLAREIEKGLAKSIGYKGSVFVLSNADLKEAAAHNPFEPERKDGEQRCHLMFLSGEPDAAHREALMALQGDEYRFFVRGRVFYFAYDRASEGKGRRNMNFEKLLGVVGTARTWRVIEKLIELTA